MSKVKFGDIVKDVKINVDRDNNPYEFYVAGDHMDSEDLYIRRRGRFATDDVGPAFTRIFKPGQVLYGSRRTYLKKVAVADFEGICANTTFVFETKDSMVFEQRLLPFLMLSERFTNWSVSHSKGSTNPYVLFSDLASYEFDLPSLKEQKVLAEKLWAAYEVKQSYLKMIDITQEMVKAQFVEMFGDPITNPKGIPMKRIKDVCKIVGGSQPPRSHFIFEYKEGYVRFIQIRDYKSDDHITYIPESSTKKFCDEDDIMIGRYGPPIFQILSGIKGAYNVALMKAIPININKEFLRFYLKRDELRHYLERFQSRSAGQAGIDMDELYNYPCPYPSAKEQENWVDILNRADKSISDLRKSIDAIDKVIKSLINENL